MLEMLLFLPLGLLVLFVGTDVGLSLLDRAAVTDAVREAAHDQIRSAGETLYQPGLNGVSVNADVAISLASRIADRVAGELGENGRRMILAAGSSGFRVEVRPVILEINPEDGAVVDRETLPGETRNPSFSALNASPDMRYATPEDFLEGALEENSGQSHYSLLSPVPGRVNERYLPVAVAMLVSVEVVSPSINPMFMNSLLGGLSAFQVHELHGVRN